MFSRQCSQICQFIFAHSLLKNIFIHLKFEMFLSKKQQISKIVRKSLKHKNTFIENS